MGLKTVISRIHYNKEAKGIFFNFLKFLSLFYALIIKFKNDLYYKGKLIPKRVNAYVISVGNLTTGGVGKTPVVAEIANYLAAKGEKVAIVSRGYGGRLSGVRVISDGDKIFFDANMAGDEPRWLAENTKAIVITSKNRYDGAKFAVDKFGATKIILDDGFQHRKLHRDLDVVLVDSQMGFGNENLLPAGPLREGTDAFKRIDKIVVVSKNIDHIYAERYAKVMSKKLKKDAVVCKMEPDYLYNIFLPEDRLPQGEKALAFSAIGQPKQFYEFLKDYLIVKKVTFDDHHNYTQRDIDKLQQACTDLDAKTLITTEKDGGKCSGFSFYLSVYSLKLKTILDVEALLNDN